VSHIFRVALDTPVRRLFDYLAPLQATAQPAPGVRVRVPFGRQRRVGVITEVAQDSEVPPARLKPILQVLDATPVLDASLQELVRWAADYYHHPLGEVLASALPRALRLGAPESAREERWRNLETECLRGFEIDDERELLRLLDRQIAGLRAGENFRGVTAEPAPHVEEIRAVGDEETALGKLAEDGHHRFFR